MAEGGEQEAISARPLWSLPLFPFHSSHHGTSWLSLLPAYIFPEWNVLIL